MLTSTLSYEMVGGVNLIGDWRVLEAWWAKRGATRDEVEELGVGYNFDPLYVRTVAGESHLTATTDS